MKRPKKTMSLKQQAQAICDPVIKRFEDEESIASHDAIYRRDFARLRLHKWLESVSNITIDELDRALVAGDWITVPYDGHQYLPGDLKIVKEYRNNWAATPLVDDHDRARTTIPYHKLFEPSLFPELNYAEIQEHSLILGDNNRVPVGRATREQWRLHDDIQEQNNKRQNDAYEAYKVDRDRRRHLFVRHPDCQNHDEIVAKLTVKVREPA